ncbi:SGNH/GDSL hydrolase family protein [Candidatus Peribacteria bacterium]|nr:MAG: SGNH/GDSL hydrolase family protein [Candidatus Peribacteria bacterium]
MTYLSPLLRRLHWWSVTAAYLPGVTFGHPLMRLYCILRRLRGKAITFSIGDSHADFTFRTLPSIIRLPLGPVTMHRIGRDGLTPFALFSTQSFLWPQRLLRTGDTICLSFGEIDCRCHIKKQIETGRTEEEVITTLASSYIESILRAQMDGVTIVIMSVTPPARAHYLEDFRVFRPQGTDEERSRYTYRLNQQLQSLAALHGLPYIDTYSRYKDTDGMLIYPLSDGKTHIKDPRGMRQCLRQTFGDA